MGKFISTFIAAVVIILIGCAVDYSGNLLAFQDVQSGFQQVTGQCQNLPARIAGAAPVQYASIQAAYDNAADGDTVQSHDAIFTEDLHIDLNKSVALKGGYDCDYNDPPDGTSLLSGNTQISSGTVSIDSGRFVTAHGGSLKIMPMGDSITRGGGYPIGSLDYPTYRYYLHNALSDAGWQVDYVGPYNGVGSDFNTPTAHPYSVPAQYQDKGHPSFPDQDLAGSTGWYIDEYLGGAMLATTLMQTHGPDIVLVHLGTNDLGTRSDTPGQAADEIGELIDKIRTGSSTVKILVAGIIPLMDGAYGQGPGEYQAVQDFNALLPGIISQKNQVPGYPPVTLVDMWNGFDPATMLAEQTHPNEAGDREMASRWYNGIASLNMQPSN